MALSNVPKVYHLNPSLTDAMVLNKRADDDGGLTPTEERVVHTFPANTNETTKHKLVVSMLALELDGRFVTLRYTDRHIPTFQLFHNGEPETQPIDLTKAFRAWGWRPDSTSEQIYNIELLIKSDGSVVIKPWIESSVSDWHDGGVVTN